MYDKSEEQIKEVREVMSRYKEEISEKLRKIDPTLVAELRVSINKDYEMKAIRKKGDGSEEGWGNLTVGGDWFNMFSNAPQPGHEGPTHFTNDFLQKKEGPAVPQTADG
jgi:hypothetical protein